MTRLQVTQGLKRATLTNPDGVATLCEGVSRTWTQVCDRVARMAGALHALGLQAGERVALLAFNSDRYYEMLYAPSWAGAVVVPMNFRHAPKEMLDVLIDSGSRFLFVDATFAKAIGPHLDKLPSLEHVVYMGDEPAPEGMKHYEELIETAKPAKDAELTDTELYGLFYTGGTTGRSKGVMLTQGNIVSNAMCMLPVANFGPDSLFLHASPMFHVADCAATFALTTVGGTHSMIDKFTPVGCLEALQQRQCTHTLLVPTMLNMVLNSPELDKYPLEKLEYILYGASPMPEALIRRLIARFPWVKWIQGLGMTEMSPLISILEPRHHVLEGPQSDKLRSVGQPVMLTELRIVDENDQDLPVGEVGQILVRGPNMMKGYWNLPEKTAEALKDGWMHTGDSGKLDKEGFVYVVDRVKDMIVTGGENVYSLEVEEAIFQHPGVKDCAVIGVPDDEWGELVHAIVVPKPEQALSEEEIIATCREHIAGYKVPRSVDFRDEPLPLSGAGKVLKTELRKPYWQGRQSAVHA